MTKKNRRTNTENEPAEPEPEVKESAPAENEAEATPPASDSGEVESPEEASTDDLLDNVRQWLIEEETHSSEKKSGWLKRIKKGLHKEAPVEEAQVEAEPIPAEQPQPDLYLNQIDELIEMLEPEAEEAKPAPTVAVEPAPLPEPEPPVDMEDLKKRVFTPQAGAPVQEESEVRAVALEGGEEIFVEVVSKREDAAQERRKAFDNALRPYRQYLYLVTAFLGIVAIVVVLSLMAPAIYDSRLFTGLRPAPTPTAGNLPYPVAMSLPGGLNFNLGRGAIAEGEWNPNGPEWLAGTEVCRWVAIPWSRQLEAVVRTLTREDAIELVMSNDDRLKYNVFAIQELTLAEMQALDQNSPCLLLVLAEQDTEKRWVVTAKP